MEQKKKGGNKLFLKLKIRQSQHTVSEIKIELVGRIIDIK